MENKITAILVDDEESARNILSNLLCQYCPQIEVLTKCEDVEEAVLAIEKYRPSIVFLDIEMPNYAGYELVSFFKEIDFEIVFVTAYDHYAIKAFEIAAIDYLLKPIDINRLKESVAKIISKDRIKTASLNYTILKESLKDKKVKNIVVPLGGDQKVISANKIIALEANEAYCFIYTEDKERYMVSKNLKHFELLFKEESNFFRTHKSWIINMNYIKVYSKSKLQIELNSDITAKLSKYKKVMFENSINS